MTFLNPILFTLTMLIILSGPDPWIRNPELRIRKANLGTDPDHTWTFCGH
jgi:hypothetical protein